MSSSCTLFFNRFFNPSLQSSSVLSSSFPSVHSHSSFTSPPQWLRFVAPEFSRSQDRKKKSLKFTISSFSSKSNTRSSSRKSNTVVMASKGIFQSDASSSTPRIMIVSDLDGTMVDHKDDSHTNLLRFNALWASEYSHDSLLVYSTGRSPTKYAELKNNVPLLTPDIVILSVGTEILFGHDMHPEEKWKMILNEGWDRKVVVEEASKFTALKFQTESEQRPHKVSFHIEKSAAKGVIESLSSILKNKGLKVKLIYSGGYDLDILPEGAGKGSALTYLLSQLSEVNNLPQRVLTCGDSGNDIELFTVKGVNGVIVGNAMEELAQWYEEKKRQNSVDHVFRASERCAGGIIQSLTHFNIHPFTSPRDIQFPKRNQDSVVDKVVDKVADNGSSFSSDARPSLREIVESNIILERWLSADVDHDVINGAPSVLSENFSLFHPSGKTLSRMEMQQQLAASYGMQKGKGWRIWIDRINSVQLAPGIWLVKFVSCEKSKDTPKTVRLCSAILSEKSGTPNGLEWVHLHETLIP